MFGLRVTGRNAWHATRLRIAGFDAVAKQSVIAVHRIARATSTRGVAGLQAVAVVFIVTLQRRAWVALIIGITGLNTIADISVIANTAHATATIIAALVARAHRNTLTKHFRTSIALNPEIVFIFAMNLQYAIATTSVYSVDITAGANRPISADGNTTILARSNSDESRIGEWYGRLALIINSPRDN